MEIKDGNNNTEVNSSPSKNNKEDMDYNGVDNFNLQKLRIS